MHKNIKAVLFDVDGTLYNQSLLRLRMTYRILINSLIFPFDAVRNTKVIKCYRNVQEILRVRSNLDKSLAVNLEEEQLKVTSEYTGVELNKVKEIVTKWFETIPLKIITGCKRKDLNELFNWLKENSYKIGLYSDYKSIEKAKVLNVYDSIDVNVSSMDSEVGVFKPDPKGFAVASLKLGLLPENVLYVGDRYEVDIIGANAAGMKAVLIGSQLPSDDKYNYEIKELSELKNILQKENS